MKDRQPTPTRRAIPVGGRLFVCQDWHFLAVNHLALAVPLAHNKSDINKPRRYQEEQC